MDAADEPSSRPTLSAYGPTLSTYGQRLDSSYRLDPTESTQSLLSRRGSDFGNRYVQVDDSGIYLSSLAVTILVSSVATIGILLFTLVITLAVMLGSCQTQPMFQSLGKQSSGDACESFRLNAEMNNVQGWVLPLGCVNHTAEYMLRGQYIMDYDLAVDSARKFLATVDAGGDGRDAIVLDIDDTVLSNLGYYVEHRFGAEVFNETSWDEWVDQRRALAFKSILSLYNELQAANWSMIFITGRPEKQRESTSQNLLEAGFSNWASLNLRLENEVGTTAVNYKSARRMHLESEGYRIWTSIGDQWSDLIGPASGNRTFKLPNPMYYIF